MSIQSSNQYSARVRVWRPIAQEGRCGHVTVSLEVKTGEKPSVTQNHLGLWPKHGWKVHFFSSMVPVLGVSTQNSHEDLLRESHNDHAFEPSESYKIPLTEEQYHLMDNQICMEREKINSGVTAYCLLPKISILKLLQGAAQKDVVNYTHSCPITHLPMEHNNLTDDIGAFQHLTVENCATVAVKVLNSAGVSVQPSKIAPWEHSPLGVGMALNHLSTQRNDISVKYNANYYNNKSFDENGKNFE